jgi:hypothetical protein
MMSMSRTIAGSARKLFQPRIPTLNLPKECDEEIDH